MYRGVSFDGTEKGYKFVEESTLRSKIGIRNLTKLDQALESLTNFHFNGLPSSKVYIFWAKKSIEELAFMKLKRDRNL